MNNIIIRVGALIAHALLNVVILSYLTNYDITGSWLAVLLFAAAVFVLIALFIRHIISFILYVKTKSK